MTNTAKPIDPPMPTCSFCGKDQTQVQKMVSGPQAYICNICIGACISIIDQQSSPKHELRMLKPYEIKKHLDQYIIGQDAAKIAISVAVYNHYKRINHIGNSSIEFHKSNVLLLGPTGSGKTLLAKTLAKILDVPFAIADATTLTESGYVGDDVENVILRLIQAADFDVAKAERGIVYIDEIDKIRRTTGNVSISRDVSGEGVQQGLLKIVEGTISNIPPKGGRKHPNQEYIKVNTENILFIVGGAFVNLEQIIAKRLGKSTIGFNANDKIQHDTARTSDLLNHLEPEDLIQFGMIPEFVGRFNSVVNCQELTSQEMIRVLTEPKNAVIKQYTALFEMEGVTLNFTDEALVAIAEKAMASKTGARALRKILEDLMRDYMFSIPSDHEISEITFTNEAICGNAKPLIKREKKKIA
jgi:ATP-dependent Clp protease ATP-binding subunit ClpX